jgi:hypothetical protein
VIEKETHFMDMPFGRNRLSDGMTVIYYMRGVITEDEERAWKKREPRRKDLSDGRRKKKQRPLTDGEIVLPSLPKRKHKSPKHIGRNDG